VKSKKLIAEVLPVANRLIRDLEPFCEKIEICGSIRRKKEMVGDIEIVCKPIKIKIPKSIQYSLFGPPKYSEKTIPGFMEYVRKYKIIRGDLDRGKIVCFETPEGVQVDVFTGGDLNYGFIKTLRTGPSEYNMDFLIPQLKSKGYALKNGFVYKGEKIVPIPDEEKLYDLIGCVMHSPEEREKFSGSSRRR
jgi:DNA polymerase/3'-5' exonuclease PolX